MNLDKLSSRHYITFFLIVFYEFASYPINNSRLTSILFAIGGILGCIFFIRIIIKEPLAKYGLQLKKMHLQIISVIMLEFMIIFLSFFPVISDNISYILSGNLIKEFVSYYFDSFRKSSLFLVLLVNVTYEEMLYRGFLLSFFQRLFKSSFMGIFLSAILFGLIHYTTTHSWATVLDAFIFGIIYGYLRIKEPEKFTLFSLSVGHFLNDILALCLSSCV